MSEEKVENQKKSQSEEIDYAYAVIDAIAESMDKVATQPELTLRFGGELLQKMPQLIDALMVITIPEHRQAIKKLLGSSSRMVASWLKATQK